MTTKPCGPPGADARTISAWFRRPLSNAHLNDLDAYYRLVPAFHRLLHEQDGDLQAFYREVSALGRLEKAERHRRLQR